MVQFGMCAHRRLRSDCADAQADLSLRWRSMGSQGSNVSLGGKLRLTRLICTLAVRTFQVVQYAGYRLSNSYTMVGPLVRGDNPRALASGLSYVQVYIHDVTIYTTYISI